MNPCKCIVIGGLLLAGCAHPARSPDPAAPVPVAAPVIAPVVAPAEPVYPNVELSSELLYDYLLSEIANQRGHKALAVEGSEEIARQTRDPRLARRAAQLALESGDMNRAVAAFRFWQELEPDAALASRMLSSLLLRGGRLDEAKTEFLKVFKQSEPAVAPVFLQIHPMLMSYPDKAAILKLAQALAEPYPAVAEAHWVVAQLAQESGQGALALSEVQQARRLRPEWSAPLAFEARLLNKSAPQRSLELMQHYLADHPAENELRLQYARALLEQTQLPAAREEFRRLSNNSPDNVELAFAVALISLQLGDLADAEQQLKQALDRGGKGQDALEYFLGQLGEAKEDEGLALTHYLAVAGGEYQYNAHLRAAYLLDKQGKLDMARQTLHQAQAATPAQRAQLLLIEAQMLRNAGQVAEAYRVIQPGLAVDAINPDLLYEAAMLADRLALYDASEQLLRKLIQLNPAHAQAYNALGYSLLERKLRTAEAVSLVEKALQLAPDDHAIMDSVGWGYYRAGRLEESIALLRRAYDGNPDPEIAAHLGEVLWVHGERDEAERIWQESIRAHPDSAPLQAVMRQFLP